MDERELRRLFHDTFDRDLPGPDAFCQLLELEGDEERYRPRRGLLAAVAAVLLAAAAAGLIAAHPRPLPGTRPAASRGAAFGPQSAAPPQEAPTPSVAEVEGEVVLASVGDEIVRSTDAGRTWSVVYRGLGDHHGNVRDLEWVSATTAFAATNYGILVSRDGGGSWRLASRRTDVWRLDFLSPTVGYVIAASSSALADGRVLLTVDGGASWSPYPVGLPVVTWIQWVDQTHAWAAGPTGVVATADTGRHWTLQLPVRGFADAQVGFTDSLHGFALFSGPTGAAALWATSDGGRSWQPASLPDGSAEHRIVVTGPSSLEMAVPAERANCPAAAPTAVAVSGCYAAKAVTASGQLCDSVDGGRTWSCRPLPFGTVREVAWAANRGRARFLAARLGSSEVLVAASADGGATWWWRTFDAAGWVDAGSG